MEATLVIVTLLSLAAAIGLAIVTWRLLRDERQRADARIAALEEGLAASLAANPPPAATPGTVRMAATPGGLRPGGLQLGGLQPSSPQPGGLQPSGWHAADADKEWRASGPTRRADRSNGGIGTSTGNAGGAAAAAAASAEIVELHSAGDPDWLAQFPSSASSTSSVSLASSASAAPLNGRSHANGVSTHTNGTRVIQMASVRPSNDADVPTQPIAALAAPPVGDAPATHTRAGEALATNAFAAERLFNEGDATTRVGASSRGILAIGVGGAVIVLLILALWSVGRLIAPGVDSRAAGGAKAAAAANAANAAPLELVALEQTRDGETLTIHGVVRNPPAGVMIDRLAVVVAFFDVSGQQLASVRAPLDFRTLAPGDESPFQVATPVPTGVTRYRVSFRRDEGTIVPHVDRRQQEES